LKLELKEVYAGMKAQENECKPIIVRALFVSIFCAADVSQPAYVYPAFGCCLERLA